MSLSSIKRRISSIETTSKITNAMKLVASSKLLKQRKVYEEIKEYYQEFYEVIGDLLNNVDEKEILSIENPKDATLWITINSNFGLCAGYNYNIYKLALNNIQPEDKLLSIGKKGKEFFKNNLNPDQLLDFDIIDVNNVDYLSCEIIGLKIYDKFKVGEFSRIKIIFTHFENVITFDPKIISLIPFDKALLVQTEKSQIFDFEPNIKEMIQEIIPQYLTTVLYGSLVESTISESASRRNAMDSATDNANNLVADYKIKYNRIRQANITAEILEIINGVQGSK